eukprot:TRINITY_DN658_c0_g1_i3.p1 TRINITY_DN658_c0_g1~~TRINITY_DN658_c0_g1_i3.p1  ORF type:complete len:404 (-),score=89.93 TRINITY_DN658_c0_g1_i3:2152-3282(-)
MSSRAPRESTVATWPSLTLRHCAAPTRACARRRVPAAESLSSGRGHCPRSPHTSALHAALLITRSSSPVPPVLFTLPSHLGAASAGMACSRRPQRVRTPPTAAACAGVAVVALSLAWSVSAEDVFCKAADCFEILGLTRTASAVEIRRAYRRLVPPLHPDVNPGNAKAAEKFKLIANAYEVLTDPGRRRAYNDFLAHPEKFGYMMEFAKTTYAPQASVWVVIVGILVAATALHWFNMRHVFYTAQARVRESEDYQREVKRLIARKEVATVEEAHKVIEVDFGDVRLPTPGDLAATQAGAPAPDRRQAALLGGPLGGCVQAAQAGLHGGGQGVPRAAKPWLDPGGVGAPRRKGAEGVHGQAALGGRGIRRLPAAQAD